MRTIPALLALALAAACGGRGGSDDAFQWSNELPAGSVIHVRNGVGDIHASTTAGPTALVRGSRAWRRSRARDIEFVVQQRGNDYWICAMWRNSGKCASSGYRGRNTSGFLSMFSLFHRNSDATADFTIELPPNVALDARTTSGEVEVEGTQASVIAHTVNGTVRAKNVGGPLALTTVNGDVRLTFNGVGAADSLYLATTNGSIHAELPPDLQGSFDLSVVNGAVRSEFPLQSTGRNRSGNHMSGQVGASTRPVRMRTISGEVVVTARPAPASGPVAP